MKKYLKAIRKAFLKSMAVDWFDFLYLHSSVPVAKNINHDTWIDYLVKLTDKEGMRVYTTDVVIEEQDFAESRAAAAQNMAAEAPMPSEPKPSAAASDGFMNIPDGLEEELPFS